MSFRFTSYFDFCLSIVLNEMYTITGSTQYDSKAVLKSGLRTTTILNSFLRLFSTFRQRLRATKFVTLKLWRDGRVKGQRGGAIRDPWASLN